jgi:hypothetical protein
MADLLKRCNKCHREQPLTRFHKKLKAFCASCKDCKSIYNKEYRAKNSEKLNAYSKDWREANKDTIKTKRKTWSSENKQLIKQRNRQYRERYPHKATEQNVRLKKSRKQSVPSWLTKDQKREIQNFYWLAKDLSLTVGEKYEVDHIVPIKGKDVCGLHVPWNLQILPKDINLEKRNKWNPDYD